MIMMRAWVLFMIFFLFLVLSRHGLHLLLKFLMVDRRRDRHGKTGKWRVVITRALAHSAIPFLTRCTTFAIRLLMTYVIPCTHLAPAGSLGGDGLQSELFQRGRIPGWGIFLLLIGETQKLPITELIDYGLVFMEHFGVFLHLLGQCRAIESL